MKYLGEYNSKRLEKFKRLEVGWNYCGDVKSPTLDDGCVEALESFLAEMKRDFSEWSLFYTAEGSLELEREDESGNLITVMFNAG